MLRITLSLLIALGVVSVYSQASTIKIISQDQEAFSSEKIIQRLVSGGLEIVDLRTNFSESSLAIGYFHDPSRYMGMEQGMVLSTGVVFDLVGENTTDNHTSFAVESEKEGTTLILSNKNQTEATVESAVAVPDSLVTEQVELPCENSVGDPDLSNEIDGLDTYDARVIELDFRATADTFYYRYVFASEEYDEYVCSPYNDVFAFYLIDKVTGKKVNTALVPNKKMPVSINTINDGNPQSKECPKTNSYLYQRNDGNQGLIFDGFTKVLDIRYPVVPGKDYTMKIAIADASDCAWDSAVLIENSSIFSYFKSFEMNFMTDSYEPLLPEKLEEVVFYINEHPESRIQLIGHSDRVGSIEHNYELSIQRAFMIREMLKSYGIDESRITETYKGESMPRYEERAKNRRVEIFVMGK